MAAKFGGFKPQRGKFTQVSVKLAVHFLDSFKPQRGKFTLWLSEQEAKTKNRFKPQRGKFTPLQGKRALF